MASHGFIGAGFRPSTVGIQGYIVSPKPPIILVTYSDVYILLCLKQPPPKKKKKTGKAALTYGPFIKRCFSNMHNLKFHWLEGKTRKQDVSDTSSMDNGDVSD